MTMQTVSETSRVQNGIFETHRANLRDVKDELNEGNRVTMSAPMSVKKNRMRFVLSDGKHFVCRRAAR